MKLTIAELIVKTLAAAGVKRICGIVGNSLNGLTEALRKQTAVEWALVRHAADALLKDPALSKFAGQVSDSGEGRWTIKAAIDEGVPVPVLTTALYERFSSRGDADFQDKLLSAMRFEFGGHQEKPAK